MSTPAHRTVPGSSYFVTTKCWQSRSLFQVNEVAEILLNTLIHYRDSKAYLLHEFVIMPDHLHVMLTPNSQTSLEKAVQLIKGGSSFRIHKARGNRMEIWQEGFHDWTIRDLEDWRAKAGYIRMNPVKARLCESAEEWAYSSASEKYAMDVMPQRYLRMASGAKAPLLGSSTPGLKPRPPEEGMAAASHGGPSMNTEMAGASPGAASRKTDTAGATPDAASVNPAVTAGTPGATAVKPAPGLARTAQRNS